MKITYKEAKSRALKKRDIWIRRFLFDLITTPVAYLLANYTKVYPMQVTVGSFVLGMVAAFFYYFGYLLYGAIFCFLCLLSDSTDGKLNRILSRDDTFRGMIDFILDGVVWIAIIVSFSTNGDRTLLLLLLVWYGTHFLDMRFTSAVYRLKVQFGSTDVWLIDEDIAKSESWILRVYGKMVKKLEFLRTYPHPTVGEATVLAFVVGPILWHITGNIQWEYWAIIVGILCIVPETVGAGLIAYQLAKREYSS